VLVCAWWMGGGGVGGSGGEVLCYLRVANSTPMVLLLSKLNLRGGEGGGGEIQKKSDLQGYHEIKKKTRRPQDCASSLIASKARKQV
jgi:hypothetical protein